MPALQGFPKQLTHRLCGLQISASWCHLPQTRSSLPWFLGFSLGLNLSSKGPRGLALGGGVASGLS